MTSSTNLVEFKKSFESFFYLRQVSVVLGKIASYGFLSLTGLSLVFHVVQPFIVAQIATNRSQTEILTSSQINYQERQKIVKDVSNSIYWSNFFSSLPMSFGSFIFWGVASAVPGCLLLLALGIFTNSYKANVVNSLGCLKRLSISELDPNDQADLAELLNLLEQLRPNKSEGELQIQIDQFREEFNRLLSPQQSGDEQETKFFDFD